MQNLLSLPMLALALAMVAAGSCAPDPPVVVHHRELAIFPLADGTVTGSAFECSGTWPSAVTPCNYPLPSRPVTRASNAADGLVQLTLGRTPAPVDGGASSVVLDLQFGFQGDVSAFAYETTTRPGVPDPAEISEPTGGMIESDVVGSSAAQRNAGRFSVSFAWGSISGTYDTSAGAAAP